MARMDGANAYGPLPEPHLDVVLDRVRAGLPLIGRDAEVLAQAYHETHSRLLEAKISLATKDAARTIQEANLAAATESALRFSDQANAAVEVLLRLASTHRSNDEYDMGVRYAAREVGQAIQKVKRTPEGA